MSEAFGDSVGELRSVSPGPVYDPEATALKLFKVAIRLVPGSGKPKPHENMAHAREVAWAGVRAAIREEQAGMKGDMNDGGEQCRLVLIRSGLTLEAISREVFRLRILKLTSQATAG